MNCDEYEKIENPEIKIPWNIIIPSVIIIIIIIVIGIILLLYYTNRSTPTPTLTPISTFTAFASASTSNSAYKPTTVCTTNIVQTPIYAPISISTSIPISSSYSILQDGIYTIFNIEWGLYMSGLEDKITIMIYTSIPQDCEEWRIIPTSTPGLYNIYNLSNGTYLISNANTSVGQNSNLTPNGYWVITENSNCSVCIQNSVSGNYLSGRKANNIVGLVSTPCECEEWLIIMS